jgi:hypothetical protein
VQPRTSSADGVPWWRAIGIALLSSAKSSIYTMVRALDVQCRSSSINITNVAMAKTSNNAVIIDSPSVSRYSPTRKRRKPPNQDEHVIGHWRHFNDFHRKYELLDSSSSL